MLITTANKPESYPKNSKLQSFNFRNKNAKVLTLNGNANPITRMSPRLRLAIKRLVTLSQFIKRNIVMITRKLPME